MSYKFKLDSDSFLTYKSFKKLSKKEEGRVCLFIF